MAAVAAKRQPCSQKAALQPKLAGASFARLRVQGDPRGPGGPPHRGHVSQWRERRIGRTRTHGADFRDRHVLRRGRGEVVMRPSDQDVDEIIGGLLRYGVLLSAYLRHVRAAW